MTTPELLEILDNTPRTKYPSNSARVAQTMRDYENHTLSPEIEVDETPYNLDRIQLPEKIQRLKSMAITENTIQTMLDAIKRGNTKKNACLLAGITVQYFNAITRSSRKMHEYMIIRHQSNLMAIERKIDQLYAMEPDLDSLEEMQLHHETINGLMEKLHQLIVEHWQEVEYLKEENLYFRAYQEILVAEAQLEDALVSSWYQLRHTDWKAARDFLAKRFAKDWADQPKAQRNQSFSVNVLQANQLSALSSGNGGNNNGQGGQGNNSNSNSNSRFNLGQENQQLTMGRTSVLHAMDLSKLTQEELDQFEKLLTKIPDSPNDPNGEMET